MESTQLSPSRVEALYKLLDDESPAVERAVGGELKRLGPEGARLLKRIAREATQPQAARALYFLRQLGIQDGAQDFRDFISGSAYELETGMLLLERVAYPETEAGTLLSFLDRLGKRCRELLVHPVAPLEHCRTINRVLLHEEGFRGNVEQFFDPDNSFLGKVIDRRRGIPISLSIIYILVARRCGLELEPVGAPGRFLVGCFSDPEPFFIDPFERGLVRTAREVRENLLGGMDHPGEIDYLAPCTTRDVLLRCCRNLVHAYAHEKDPGHARLFSEFAQLIKEQENDPNAEGYASHAEDESEDDDDGLPPFDN